MCANSTFEVFRPFLHKNESFEDRTLEDFATDTVRNGPGSLRATMFSLRNVALGTSGRYRRGTSGTRSSAADDRRRRRRFVVKDGLFQQLQKRFKVGMWDKMMLALAGYLQAPHLVPGICISSGGGRYSSLVIFPRHFFLPNAV